MKYWLVKTEPSSFSIEMWAKIRNKKTCWDGVRNYQARNFLRDQMTIGDQVLVYHSNAKPPAMVGLAEVASKAYPDPTAWDPEHEHFDPKTKKDSPQWFMVDLKLLRVFDAPLPLPRLKEIAALKEMELLRKGSRLSVQPVRKAEYTAIMKLAAPLEKHVEDQPRRHGARQAITAPRATSRGVACGVVGVVREGKRARRLAEESAS